MKTFVLIHGGFHGGWCWRDVATRLRGRGHSVHTPTLTGLGDRHHLMTPEVDLELFAQDISNYIFFEDIQDAIIVGHSFGGSLVTLMADRMPERLRHLVYLDAMLLESGMAPADACPPGHIDRYVERSIDDGRGRVIPVPDPTAFGVTDPDQIGWMKDRLRPQPLRTFLDRIVLKNPLGNGLPTTYIACTNPAWNSTAYARNLAKEKQGWSYVEIPTAHDAMVLMPDELSAVLERIK